MISRENILHFFKDSKGRIVILQRPNIPLVGWLASKLLSLPTQSYTLKSGFELLSTGFLFTWAYLEIISGDSYFRRVLGGAIMALLVAGFFRH